MRHPHWIQTAVVLALLAGAIAVVWIQLRPETRTRRLRLVKPQDGAVEGASLGRTLPTRQKLERGNG